MCIGKKFLQPSLEHLKRSLFKHVFSTMSTCLFVFILFNQLGIGGCSQKAKACLRCLPMAHRSTLIISGFYPYHRIVQRVFMHVILGCYVLQNTVQVYLQHLYSIRATITPLYICSKMGVSYQRPNFNSTVAVPATKPWFYCELGGTTTSDIEVRLCDSRPFSRGFTLTDQLEIYAQ